MSGELAGCIRKSRDLLFVVVVGMKGSTREGGASAECPQCAGGNARSLTAFTYLLLLLLLLFMLNQCRLVKLPERGSIFIRKSSYLMGEWRPESRRKYIQRGRRFGKGFTEGMKAP